MPVLLSGARICIDVTVFKMTSGCWIDRFDDPRTSIEKLSSRLRRERERHFGSLKPAENPTLKSATRMWKTASTNKHDNEDQHDKESIYHDAFVDIKDSTAEHAYDTTTENFDESKLPNEQGANNAESRNIPVIVTLHQVGNTMQQ